MRYEIVQKVVADIEKKARAQVDAKPTAQRTVGQNVMQNWDCSHIENEEEDEEEDWQKEDLKEVQWAGGLGKKKDGKKLFAGGSHTKGTGVSGA